MVTMFGEGFCRTVALVGALLIVPTGVIEQPSASEPKPDQRPDVIFVPTPQVVVEKMLEMAKVQANELVFDLGSGDGRIPITAAKKFGARAFGYELDTGLIKESQENARKQGVADRATFERRDIFKLDLSKADVVTLYLLPGLNRALVPQLEKMKPGSRVITHAFRIEGYQETDSKLIELLDEHRQKKLYWVYLYTVPLKKDSK
jgi:tRNA G37 N-methylase Trm5